MSRPFYGWVIAGASLVALMVTNGMIIGGINVFDEALLEEFGWSRAALKFRDLLTFAIAGLLGPLAGAIADRFGVKRPMLFGALLLAGCYFFYGRVSSIGQMYVIHTLFALVLATCGLIVTVMLVSHWFVAKRGTAIGIALVGTSLGGVLFPKLGTALISSYGWRTAFAIEAAFPIALLVVIALLVRDRPETIGLEPLGASQAAGAGPTSASGLAYGEALRTGTFWALAFAAMTTFYSILGAQAHLFLHFRDLGFEPATAASALATLYLMALVGKFAWGFLADVLPQKRVLLVNIGVMWLGSVLLATLQPNLVWPAVLVFGLGWGGLYTLLQLLTMNTFGLKASGKILGTITVLDAIGGGLGIWLTGLLYDRTGGYQVPFTVLAVLIALAWIAATQVRPRVR
ncbi:MAG: MFS transporter [Acidobacteriota bacterium]